MNSLLDDLQTVWSMVENATDQEIHLMNSVRDRIVEMYEWTDIETALPEPMTEVLVWVDGHRGTCWRNGHHLVAYLSPSSGNWREERHMDNGPLEGVVAWRRLPEPYIQPSRKRNHK